MDVGVFSEMPEGNTEHPSLVHFTARSGILENLLLTGCSNCGKPY